ncbi:uncharacterized protein METZ01_LOCUS240620, partial [marine metagenome]
MFVSGSNGKFDAGDDTVKTVNQYVS